jgi:hypothetical protein
MNDGIERNTGVRFTHHITTGQIGIVLALLGTMGTMGAGIWTISSVFTTYSNGLAQVRADMATNAAATDGKFNEARTSQQEHYEAIQSQALRIADRVPELAAQLSAEVEKGKVNDDRINKLSDRLQQFGYDLRDVQKSQEILKDAARKGK